MSSYEVISSQKEIEIKNLKPFLQWNLDDDQLLITNIKVTRLLPSGENYCSLLVKMDVDIRNTESADEAQVHLVAKMPIDSGRCFINWKDVFEKEVFVYAELLPKYREIEKKMGFEEENLIDILPKYVGHRRSLNDDNDVVDENSLLLMENLKTKGYETGNRFAGLDLEHARIALTWLSRYHALGIALKSKEPEFFKKALVQAKIMGGDLHLFKEGLDSILKNIKEEFCNNELIPFIEKSFDNVISAFQNDPEEPWATITHGDFWVNNIMFHKNNQNQVDGCKFVDFQTYLYNSPLRDVVYFLCGSLEDNADADHFDDLLNMYYDGFVRSIDRLGCSTRGFSKTSFERELKRQAVDMFPLCALVCKFFVFEVEKEVKGDGDNNELLDRVFESKCSPSYVKKLRKLITIYDQRNWFR